MTRVVSFFDPTSVRQKSILDSRLDPISDTMSSRCSFKLTLTEKQIFRLYSKVQRRKNGKSRLFLEPDEDDDAVSINYEDYPGYHKKIQGSECHYSYAPGDKAFEMITVNVRELPIVLNHLNSHFSVAERMSVSISSLTNANWVVAIVKFILSPIWRLVERSLDIMMFSRFVYHYNDV